MRFMNDSRMDKALGIILILFFGLCFPANMGFGRIDLPVEVEMLEVDPTDGLELDGGDGRPTDGLDIPGDPGDKFENFTINGDPGDVMDGVWFPRKGDPGDGLSGPLLLPVFSS